MLRQIVTLLTCAGISVAQQQTVDHADSQNSGSTISRMAWQSGEGILTDANAANGGFQLLFQCAMNAPAGSQPLYLTVTVNGVVHHAVYIASSGDNISPVGGNTAYLFDVSGGTCQTLWSTQLGNISFAPNGNGCLNSGAYDTANGWIFQACKENNMNMTLYKLNASTGSVMSSQLITYSTTGTGDQTGGVNPVVSAVPLGASTGVAAGTYTGITLNGSSGTGALATVTVPAGCTVTCTGTITAAITAGGSGYLIGQTFTANVTSQIAGSTSVQLTVTTGNVFGTNTGVKDTVTSGSYPFLPALHRSRPGLSLCGGNVLVDIGSGQSTGDIHPWHGAVVSYSESSLAQNWATSLSPNGYGASLWASGRGDVFDSSCNQYVVTGNGDNVLQDGASSTGDWGDSICELSSAGAIVGCYTPVSSTNLEALDSDASSNGIVCLPNNSGVCAYIAWEGKDAVLRTVPLTCLAAGTCGSSIQTFSVLTGTGDKGNGSRGMTFANNVLYISSTAGAVYGYTWNPSSALFAVSPVVALTAAASGWKYPGASCASSSDGATGTVIWCNAVNVSMFGGPQFGAMYALHPTTLATLWQSTTDFASGVGLVGVGTNAAKPATCTIGQLYYATDLSNNLLNCSATNVWSAYLARIKPWAYYFAARFVPPTPLGNGRVVMPIGSVLTGGGPVGVAALNVYGFASNLPASSSGGGSTAQ